MAIVVDCNSMGLQKVLIGGEGIFYDYVLQKGDLSE